MTVMQVNGEAAQIAAEGYPITLIGGVVVRLRYSMASIKGLEDRFGSLGALGDEVNRAGHGKACTAHATPEPDATVEARVHRSPGHGMPLDGCPDCTPAGKVFSVIVDAIAPGLLHERITDPDTGVRVRLGRNVELLAEMMDPARLQDYLEAWRQAFTQAFGNLDGSGNAEGALTPPSPGPAGTTSEQSLSGAATGTGGV